MQFLSVSQKRICIYEWKLANFILASQHCVIPAALIPFHPLTIGFTRNIRINVFKLMWINVPFSPEIAKLAVVSLNIHFKCELLCIQSFCMAYTELLKSSWSIRIVRNKEFKLICSIKILYFLSQIFQERNNVEYNYQIPINRILC